MRMRTRFLAFNRRGLHSRHPAPTLPHPVGLVYSLSVFQEHLQRLTLSLDATWPNPLPFPF